MIDYFMFLIPKTANNHVRFHIHKLQFLILFTDGPNWFHACVYWSVSLLVLIAWGFFLRIMTLLTWVVVLVFMCVPHKRTLFYVSFNELKALVGVTHKHAVLKKDDKVLYHKRYWTINMDVSFLSSIFKIFLLTLLFIAGSNGVKFGEYNYCFI